MICGMRPSGSAQQLEARRRQAVAFLRRGKTYRWIATTLNASLSSVVRWWQEYQRKGLRGLRAHPSPGRPSLLSEQQIGGLEKHLVAGPLKAGYSTDLWKLKRIRRLIERHYGVHYTEVGVWKVLRQRLRWSCQKPERRATERDKEKIERWKRYRWPRIKKRATTWGPSGFPRRKRVPAHSQCS